MDGKIGVPTVSGMTGAVKHAGIGAVGGALVNVSQRFFGTGIWGSVAGIVIAGSVLKGVSSDIVATVLGYEIGKQVLSGSGFLGLPKASSSGSSYEVI